MILTPLLFATMLEAAAPAAAVQPGATPATVQASAPAADGRKLSYTLCHINTPAIALTFDDGPHPKNTPRLLDMLKERGLHATFFLIGRSIGAHPEIVRRIVAEGHEVANHTWDHKGLRTMSEKGIDDELQKTHDAIVEACGVAPVVFRPPFGAINSKQEKAIMDKFHYSAILWEVDTNDWKSPRTVAKVHDTILKDTHAGSIILCHDIHEPTIDAMPSTLDELKAKGFQFVTVSQLIALEAEEARRPPPAAPAPITPSAGPVVSAPAAPPTPAAVVPTPVKPAAAPVPDPAAAVPTPSRIPQTVQPK